MRTATVRSDTGPSGHLVAGDRDGAVVAFIGAMFDRPGRPGLADFLPAADDRLWSWRDARGSILSALITRTWTLADGLAGVNLGYVCTRPDAQRSGFGTALVRAVMEREEEGGAAFVMAWARDHLLGDYGIRAADDVRLHRGERHRGGIDLGFDGVHPLHVREHLDLRLGGQ